MEKRGQASMEFLMTYGWAILAAVIAIGVLAYYGVFSPGNSLPSICTLNAPLGCDEFQVNTTHVQVIVRNGAGTSITLHNLSVSGCGSDSTGYSVADGGTQPIVIACTTGEAGVKFNGAVTAKYLRSGKTINETSTGDIRAAIQA